MEAQKALLAGLAFAHLAWLWFWFCGSLVRRPRRDPTVEGALNDLILASVSGIALTGFATFALGLAHALYAVTALAAIPATFILLALRGDSALKREFWATRLTQVRRAATPGAVLVWLIAAVVAVPALIPDNGSDATAGYLPQAFDYAQSHALVVDQWIRFPYYPFNWSLIQAWPMILGFADQVQFLNALAGFLTLLGVYGLIVHGARAAGDPAGLRGVGGIGVAAVIGVASAPIYLHVVDIGMLDVPSGMLMLAITTACVVALGERTLRTLPDLICAGAFLIGLKLSFIALVPFVVLLGWAVLRGARASRRTFAVAAIALTVLSAPWYVRAFILSGDPLDPVLNMRIQGKDARFTREDMAGQLGDLQTDNTPRGLLTLPATMFFDPESRAVRDVGVSLMTILFPLPIAFVGWALARRRLKPTPLVITATSVLYCYAYWTLTSHLGRYALLFLPVLAAFIGILAARLTARSAVQRYAAVLMVLALATPSPASASFLNTVWITEYAYVGVYYTSRDVWLELRSPAYPEIKDIAHLLHRAKRPDLNTYMVELAGSTYFFKQAGVQIIGDAFGPGRFNDLARALRHDDLASFLREFHLGVVVIARGSLDSEPRYDGLEEQITKLGWRRSQYPHSDWVVFTDPSLPAIRQGESAPAAAATPPGASK